MTGRQLYDRYSYHMAEQGREVPEWEDLSNSEQHSWEGLAEWATDWEDTSDVVPPYSGEPGKAGGRTDV